MIKVFYFVVAIRGGFATFFYAEPPDTHQNRVLGSGTALIQPLMVQPTIRRPKPCEGDTVYVNGMPTAKIYGRILELQPESNKGCVTF
jgi:hypothetical protein